MKNNMWYDRAGEKKGVAQRGSETNGKQLLGKQPGKSQDELPHWWLQPLKGQMPVLQTVQTSINLHNINCAHCALEKIVCKPTDSLYSYICSVEFRLCPQQLITIAIPGQGCFFSFLSVYLKFYIYAHQTRTAPSIEMLSAWSLCRQLKFTKSG